MSNTETELNPLEILKTLMVRDGLSASEAVRKYTDAYGLPPVKIQRRTKE